MYNHIVGVLAILGQISAVVLLVHLIWKPKFLSWIDQFGPHALLLAFFGALFAFVGSYIYSNIFQYAPCMLCWWQRIFMFPLVPLLAVALWKKDRNFFAYPIVLVIIGGAIAIYHIYEEATGDPLGPCDASGVSCAARYVWEFGYIGIPMLSLTAFTLIGLLLWLYRKHVNASR